MVLAVEVQMYSQFLRQYPEVVPHLFSRRFLNVAGIVVRHFDTRQEIIDARQPFFDPPGCLAQQFVESKAQQGVTTGADGFIDCFSLRQIKLPVEICPIGELSGFRGPRSCLLQPFQQTLYQQHVAR